jgi:hypothetical protein
MIGFVGIGLVIAGVGEMQFSVFIRSDINNLLGSIVFNAVYLTVADLVSWRLVTRFGDCLGTIAWHVGLFGTAGLMIEWFLIGNSPWGNPQASQIGMFSYWSAMVVVPFVFLRPDTRLSALKKTLVVSVLLYTIAALVVQLIAMPTVQFVYHIWAFLLGYTALILHTVIGYARAVTGVSIAGPRARQA